MNSSNHDPAPSPVVVITGASAGVGRATARAFAQKGARIGLLARGSEGLAGSRADVESLGGQAIAIPTDVADADAVERAADLVEEAFGPIDIWVNNAMVTVYGELLDVEPDEFRRVTDVCYHGTVFGTRAALRRMLPRDRGTIVQVGSALAYRGIPLQAAYCGAKHAVHGMFESVRAELLHNGSRVTMNMVQLPALNTPQFEWGRTKLERKPQPVPPIYEPEIAADAIVYAATAGRHRREIYVGYPSVQVILGNKVAPGLADRHLARSGYDDQMRDEPVGPDRHDNLFEPVEQDAGAHGPFGGQATRRSLQWWATRHRALIGGSVAGVAGIVGGALIARH